MDRDELVDALANRVLRLAHAIEQKRESDLSIKREFTECRELWEDLAREAGHDRKSLGERLAKIEVVLGIIREDTGAHPKEEPTALRIMDRWAAWPSSVRWATIVLVIAALGTGWAIKIVEWAIGK